MDGLAIQLGRATCEAVSVLGALSLEVDAATSPPCVSWGYCLLGVLLFLAGFLTMSRTHQIGRM
jgi:hypothetical protein